jgi:iron complex transport system permease protein
MQRFVAIAVILAAPLSLVAGLWFGSVHVPADEWLAAVAGGGAETSREIIWSLRAPRVASAFACGALLALAGALLQVLLRNPLADASILGVSGGASVGALTAILLGLPGWAVHGLAFGGACAAAGTLLALALRVAGWNVHRVLLTGVAIGAACGAVVSMLLALASAGQVQGMLFWLLGDLSGADRPAAPWIALVAVAAAAQPLAQRLDALTLGVLKARSLGVAVGATQAMAFLAATVATVAAVLVAGPIGFVGIVVPHALRLAGFSDHARLLPLTALGGGALVAFADTLARSAAAPLEFPVGAVTALVGVPVLLALLARTR